jgi:hypothetical protein
MKNIKVYKASGDSLISQLESFYKTFKEIDNLEKVSFDLTELDWINPLLISTISAYIYHSKSEILVPNDSKIYPYLNKISFPDGVSSVAKIVHFNKSYTPVSKLDSNVDSLERNKIFDCFLDLIYKIIGEVAGAKTAMFYPLTELTNNIFEHSKSKIGFLFGQSFDHKKCLDICIVDKGRGIKRSYKEEKGLNYSDEEALTESLKGHSTKNAERGFGIYTSGKLICHGLGGEYMIISGNAVYIQTKEKEILTTLKGFNWEGVIVMYKIPFPKGKIDITPYIE